MIIESSALKLESDFKKEQKREMSESLSMWKGNRPPSRNLPTLQNAQPLTQALPRVQISDAALSKQSGEANAVAEGIDKALSDPKLKMLMAIIAMLTGKEARVFDAKELHDNIVARNQNIAPKDAPQQSADFGIEYDYHESYSEFEQTNLNASGIIKTADGKEINFNLSLSMSRSYYEESNVSLRLGDARKTIDPLVINFNGNAAELTSQRFKFDLNADGQEDDINFVTGGSGFLVLDKNGDGKINNGSEMFGALTGNGFSELAQYDLDKNNWIDENDSIYHQLQIWMKDNEGNDRLMSLKEADIGAISLLNIATPFDVKNDRNELQGQIKSSGIYLYENGAVGTIQQVDLTV